MGHTYKIAFLDTIRLIEAYLYRYYDFKHSHSVIDFLISKAELEKQLKKTLEERAAVYLLNSVEEMYLSVYFNKKIRQKICNADPKQRLNEANLDAFCVLVEEISHFHLLITRASRQQKTKKIELEWQAEIDKMLLSSYLLKKQSGRTHSELLLRIFYNNKNLTKPETSYLEADNHALSFWSRRHLQLVKRQDSDLQTKLRQLYYQDWQEKHRVCA